MKPYDKLEVEFLSFFNKALTLNTNQFTPVKNPLLSIRYEVVWLCLRAMKKREISYTRREWN